MNTSVESIIKDWGANGGEQRLGQFFVNKYLDTKHAPWPTLYYEGHTDYVIGMIMCYLDLKKSGALK